MLTITNCLISNKIAINSYIKLYLLPDRSKSGKRKSAIKKADLNPKFDETFTFSQLGLRDLEQRTLWLSVWHKDRLGRNDFLGEIILPLESATQTLLQTNREHKWYKLQERVSVSKSIDYYITCLIAIISFFHRSI